VANPAPYCYGFLGDIITYSAPASRCRVATAERNPVNLFNAAVAGLPANPAAAAFAPTPTRKSALPYPSWREAPPCAID